MTTALTPEQIKPVAYQFAIRQETEDGWAITGWAYCSQDDYKALMIPKRALYDEATVKTLQSRIEALDAELAACKKDAQPMGWKMAPLEPTEEMIEAAEKAETRHLLENKRRGGNDPQLGFGEVYRAMLDVAPVAAQPTEQLLDPQDGENRAVRAFLLLYSGTPGLTFGTMKKHMEMSGFPHWPDWVGGVPDKHHLSKLGAQNWLRHLFALESATTSKGLTE